MVHLRPLPGTPFYDEGSFEYILETAVTSACALSRAGAHGCLVQTVDRVYDSQDKSDPARTAALAVIVHTITARVRQDFAVGVQMMRNAIMPSLAVAKVTGAKFVRATALVGSTHSDGGSIEGDPYAVMAYRRYIGATDVAVIADIASLHHQPNADIGQLARRAARAGAAAVAVGSPDETRTLEWLMAVRAATPNLPVLVAGNTNHGNAAKILLHADGVFVGTCLESGGWGSTINEERAASYVDIVQRLPLERGLASEP